MSKGEEDKSFSLEELPKVLYNKLDEILAKTNYQSLQSLAGSSYEKIRLVAPNALDIWMDINDGTTKNKPNGTMDLYHIKIENGEEIKLPHLRFFCDILFGEMKIRYLQQPAVQGYFVPNEQKKGELDAYLYTLTWLVSLQDKEYR